jgi:hypothetical protein
MEQRHQPWPQLNQGLEQENIAGNLHRYPVGIKDQTDLSSALRAGVLQSHYPFQVDRVNKMTIPSI